MPKLQENASESTQASEDVILIDDDDIDIGSETEAPNANAPKRKRKLQGSSTETEEEVVEKVKQKKKKKKSKKTEPVVEEVIEKEPKPKKKKKKSKKIDEEEEKVEIETQKDTCNSDNCKSLYDGHVALKSKFDDLQKRHEELLVAYQKQKAKCDEQEAKANGIKESNRREARKCIEMGDDALKSKDYAKAEKFYKKATLLDLHMNFNDLMDPINLAKKLEREEQEEAEQFRASAAEAKKQKVMQLTCDSTLNDLKKSYAKFARLLHPDKCQVAGATEAFQVVGRSKQTLHDKLPQL